MTEWNIFDSVVCWFRLYEEPLIDIPLDRLNQVSIDKLEGFAE